MPFFSFCIICVICAYLRQLAWLSRCAFKFCMFFWQYSSSNYRKQNITKYQIFKLSFSIIQMYKLTLWLIVLLSLNTPTYTALLVFLLHLMYCMNREELKSLHLITKSSPWDIFFNLWYRVSQKHSPLPFFSHFNYSMPKLCSYKNQLA